MTVEAVTEIANNALFLIIEVSLPVLLVSLIVGLIICIFLSVTSIQVQTLTFVPKIICVFLGLMIFGHWMISTMVEFTTQLWSSFSLYVNR